MSRTVSRLFDHEEPVAQFISANRVLLAVVGVMLLIASLVTAQPSMVPPPTPTDAPTTVFTPMTTSTPTTDLNPALAETSSPTAAPAPTRTPFSGER